MAKPASETKRGPGRPKKEISPSENEQSSTNGENDFDHRHRFAKGNKAAQGRTPEISKRRNQLAAALQMAVTEADIKAIVKKLVEKAKEGDTFAAREVLDRCCGKPEQPITGEIRLLQPRVE